MIFSSNYYLNIFSFKTYGMAKKNSLNHNKLFIKQNSINLFNASQHKSCQKITQYIKEHMTHQT